MCERRSVPWCNPRETGARHAESSELKRRKGGERGRPSHRGPGWSGAHLNWQAASQCPLFDVKLVLARLKDVQGNRKMWIRSQKSMPGWIHLLGMLGKMVGGGDDERWHQAWMDAQCNNATWGQTVSLPVGRHLNPALTEHTCTLLWHTFVMESLWEIAVGHLRTSFSHACLMNFSMPPPSLFVKKRGETGKLLFHPLLQLAVMEAIRNSDGRGWAVSGVCACGLLGFSVQVGHRKGCISAAELLMLFRYCTASSNVWSIIYLCYVSERQRVEWFCF